MQFNSTDFLLVLLPAAFAGFYLLSYLGWLQARKLWLVACSLALYAWWRPSDLPILLASLGTNHLFAHALALRPRRCVLIAGIVCNCLYLAYFKYTFFIVENANTLFDQGWSAPAIILPLGISFFTFQQIAYLIDVQGGRARAHSLLDQALFISFFPYVISGPITHANEVVPQFNDPERFRPRLELISLGLTIFLVGLFKKVLVADQFGPTVDGVFSQAQGGGVAFVEAWIGALAFSLQMYFDFSGYSDMAVGLGLLFGIALPLNFNSPYKARNVIEFWSRWHMTLTRFLTAYIYNPLVLSLTRRRLAAGRPLPRRGRMSLGTFIVLVTMPTLLTMLVSGIWHGAGWQFIAFGALHGLFLVVAHAWRALKARRERARAAGPVAVGASVMLTFLCATVALVFFRAPNVETALDVLAGMAGLNGIVLPEVLGQVRAVGVIASAAGATFGELSEVGLIDFARIAVFLGVVWLLPNVYEWLRHFPTALDFRPTPREEPSFFAPAWKPSPALGAAMGAVGLFVILYSFSAAPAEFLYSQF